MSEKKLNLLDSTTIIMGSMIGSGIFIVSAEISRQVHTPGMMLLTWAITAVVTVFGALSFGELAAAMPRAGGQYVYLSEAYSPIFGFMYGWTTFAVILTGTIAAVAVAFAKFTGVFFPSISGDNHLLNIGTFHINTQQVLAVCVVIFLSLYNFRNVKAGAFVQNFFTIIKAASLVLLIAFGFYFGSKTTGDWSHFSPAWPDIITISGIGIMGAAMTGSLFSADAWYNVSYTAGEIKNPQRNLPLSLAIGTGSVMLLYFLANMAYLYVLPIDQIQTAENDRVGTLMMQTILGNSGKFFMASMIMISTFGCLNGLILTGARVYYAMAKDNLFFKSAGKLNRNEVPANSLVIQCIWACLLCFSGTYSDLLNYIMFAAMVFFILTIAAVFVLRIRKPEMARPYKAFGYPIVPGLYVLMALFICVVMLIYNFNQAVWGLVIMLVGIPVYYLFRKFSSSNV